MLSATLALLLQAEAPVAPPASPPKCDTPEHAAFDFWVGEWDVFPAGSDKQVGKSVIERLYNGCAIRENWKPLNGNAGGSLSNFDPNSGSWHQRWVGSTPGQVDFTGGVSNGKMVLTGNWPSPRARHQLIRMTYSKEEDGSVRQFGEASLDYGVKWAPAFDFIYRPEKEALSQEPTQ